METICSVLNNIASLVGASCFLGNFSVKCTINCFNMYKLTDSSDFRKFIFRTVVQRRN